MEKRQRRKTKKEGNERVLEGVRKKKNGGVEVDKYLKGIKQGAGIAKNDIAKKKKSTPFFVLFRAADPSNLSIPLFHFLR